MTLSVKNVQVPICTGVLAAGCTYYSVCTYAIHGEIYIVSRSLLEIPVAWNNLMCAVLFVIRGFLCHMAYSHLTSASHNTMYTATVLL